MRTTLHNLRPFQFQIHVPMHPLVLFCLFSSYIIQSMFQLGLSFLYARYRLSKSSYICDISHYINITVFIISQVSMKTTQFINHKLFCTAPMYTHNPMHICLLFSFLSTESNELIPTFLQTITIPQNTYRPSYTPTTSPIFIYDFPL